MPRPRRIRRIQGMPESYYFKPQGIPLRQLETIDLTLEEFEALRLRYVEVLHQEQCAEQMHISQSTFQRILAHSLQKVSSAITSGKAIRIHKQ